MANIDNPNGFQLISSLYGHSELVQGNVYKAAAVLNIARGDAVIEDGATAGKVDLAVAASGLLLGVSNDILSLTAAQALVGAPILFYPALPGNVFEGQCEGTYALTYRYNACDIIGATGIMEVDENASSTTVIYVIGEDPNTEIGANSRVQFIVMKSSFYPVLAD